jgi:hypothetical protein
MEGFTEYESKPIKRLAYCITGNEVIQAIDANTFAIAIGQTVVTFKAYETFFPGDFVIYLSENDVYHCRQAVFHERNIV